MNRMGNTVGSLRQQKMSSREEAIIIGTILGDGHLARMKTTTRLEICHSSLQEKYIRWKYKELQSIVGAQPRKILIHDRRYGKTYRQWRIKTHGCAFLHQLYSRFYLENGKKIIPQNITQILTSPLSLAVWFMDDGGRRNDSYGMFLNTLSFTKEEHVLLMRCLRNNFSLESRMHWIQDGYRIYIPSSSAQKFCAAVYSSIIPSMRYKLSYNPVTTSFARLDRARDRRKRK